MEDNEQLTSFCLSKKTKAALGRLRPVLQNLHSMMDSLQDPHITMADVRVLFDVVMEKYPKMNNHLKEDSAIILSPAFESALVKLQQDRCGDFTSEEEAVKSLVCRLFLFAEHVVADRAN